MSPNRNNERLPPPAFPPGTRKHAYRNSDGPPAVEERPEGRGTDAFISPDDPMPPRGDAVPHEEGVATGVGESPRLGPGDLHASLDAHVAELVEAVGKLVEALRRKGEEGLRTAPEMSRFEATLRSYCVGYLTGRRAESEAAEG